MNRKSDVARLLLGAALLAGGVPASAMAASQQTATANSTVTITVPDLIILDYYSQIKLNLAGTKEMLDNDTLTLSGNLSDVTQSGDGLSSPKSSNLAAFKGTTTFTANNAWAVRGFSSNGKATINITGPTDNKFTSGSAGSSYILLSGLKALSGGSNVTNITGGTTLAGATPTYGNIQMDLDFSKTTMAGDYSGQITITASTL